MDESGFGIERSLEAGFSDALALTKKVLEEGGFKVMTELDVQEIMQEKTGKPYIPYVMLGLRDSDLASDALGIDADVSLMIPCNVAVFEQSPGQVVVKAVLPRSDVEEDKNLQLAMVAEMAQVRLHAAMAALEERAAE